MPADNFPGRMRPGLIEATEDQRNGVLGTQAFQGACALASLKP